MTALGTSIHALAVVGAARVCPVHGEHVRDTMARQMRVVGDPTLRLQVESEYHGAIVLCPNARGAYKEWPTERWAELALALEGEGHAVLQEDATADLSALARLLAGARLVIAVDSGPIHLADVLGVPVIGLYAATSAVTYGPYSQRGRCIDKHRQATAAQGLPYDSARHLRQGDAMTLITVDEVLEAVRRG